VLGPEPDPPLLARALFLQFRFSSCQDRLLIFVAIVAAVCGGCTLPVMIVLFGDLVPILPNTF
jgi:hypothetical protein